MGSASSRNVSQWSQGEYYLANNTQDDLSVIAANLSYRTDDHGDTPQLATPLRLTGGTNITHTTPETDPDGTDSSNKGVLEQTTDVDVFSFTTGNGLVRLTVKPWISPSGSRAGNLDLSIELRDATGGLIAADNPPASTGAQLERSLVPGTYSLHIRNSGAGTPLASTPSGYTSYGSVGQFFISGSTTPAVFIAPRLDVTLDPISGASVLNWITAPGRRYTIWWSSNVTGRFVPLPGASNLPADVTRFTNAVAASQAFFRLEALNP
jgi:hypothetical protein